jgi:hypothetical protein
LEDGGYELGNEHLGLAYHVCLVLTRPGGGSILTCCADVVLNPTAVCRASGVPVRPTRLRIASATACVGSRTPLPRHWARRGLPGLSVLPGSVVSNPDRGFRRGGVPGWWWCRTQVLLGAVRPAWFLLSPPSSGLRPRVFRGCCSPPGVGFPGDAAPELAVFRISCLAASRRYRYDADPSWSMQTVAREQFLFRRRWRHVRGGTSVAESRRDRPRSRPSWRGSGSTWSGFRGLLSSWDVPVGS